MNYKINTLKLLFAFFIVLVSILLYKYHLKSITSERANAIVSLGESMAESDITHNNLRWFWYTEGFNTNYATNQFIEKKYQIRINWDMAVVPDDFIWRKVYNSKINEYVIEKYGKNFYALYDDAYKHYE